MLCSMYGDFGVIPLLLRRKILGHISCWNPAVRPRGSDSWVTAALLLRCLLAAAAC
jgi:hypothetical protein